jgi:60S ribosomal subunit assembly/export protein LOC1
MAPNPSSKKGTKKPGSSAAPTKKLGVSKVSKSRGKAPPAKQQKTKSKVAGEDRKKKKRVYTDEELGIPKLNMVTPVGVQKPRGKKKGKVFVDDAVSDPTSHLLILAVKP